MPGHGSSGAAANSPPSTTLINFANCKKIFIQRDYSEGCGVKFVTRFPTELEGRIEPQQFQFTLNMLNSMYAEAFLSARETLAELPRAQQAREPWPIAPGHQRAKLLARELRRARRLRFTAHRQITASRSR